MLNKLFIAVATIAMLATSASAVQVDAAIDSANVGCVKTWQCANGIVVKGCKMELRCARN